MLWSNPDGFSPNSGEFVKIQLPWLPEPWGSQWHPFSLYLKEATATGLSVMNAPGEELAESSGRVFPGAQAKGGSEIVPSSTALLMIEFQNEFASPGGKLHLSIKGVMDSLDVLAKCQSLCAAARQAGAKVFHLPISFEKPDGSDNPNAKLGILKGCQDGQLFRAHSWGADFHPMMSPAPGDVVIRGKRGLDSFPGTDLEARLREHGIETVVLGGFITNCCVESTMRTAFEKGFNTITLTDGTACFSAAEQDAATNGTFKVPPTRLRTTRAARAAHAPEPTDHTHTLPTQCVREVGGCCLSLSLSLTLTLTLTLDVLDADELQQRGGHLREPRDPSGLDGRLDAQRGDCA